MQTAAATRKIDARPYNWPVDGGVDPKTTALVIIDMQEDFCNPNGYLAFQGLDVTRIRSVIPQVKALLDAFRAASFPIYHTREGHRPDLSTLSAREKFRSKNNASGLGIGDVGPMGRLLVRGEQGHDFIPELYPLPTEAVIDKPGRSAFTYTDFKLLLDIRGIKNLIICGITTDVCVMTTLSDANDMGLDCLLVTDASTAGLERLHQAAVDTIVESGGIFGAVTSTTNVLRALGGEMPCNLQ